MVSICISLMNNKLEPIFICLFGFFLIVKDLFNFLLICFLAYDLLFSYFSVYDLFLINILKYLYMFWIWVFVRHILLIFLILLHCIEPPIHQWIKMVRVGIHFYPLILRGKFLTFYRWVQCLLWWFHKYSLPD